MTTGVASACPQCGAPLRFGGAQSLAARCGYCRASVLRRGAKLEASGTVPDLVATDTRLSLGATGRAGEEPFVVLGRLQLSRGDATWNEWYASFPRGFGWLAEAQGRLFLTRPVGGGESLPRFGSLRAGRTVEVPGAGPVVVDEVDEATLIAFEGELPFAPAVGAKYHYADCSGESGATVTLDYGTLQEPPEIYAGREVGWEEVGLPAPPPPAAGAEKAVALACPHCGGPVALRSEKSRAVTCPSCRGLLDVSRGGLRVVEILRSRSEPPIPLGAKGTLRGEALEVLGWLRRSMEADGIRYAWDEILLHGAGGYRWLSTSGGHWLLLRPIPAGKARGTSGASYRCDGRTFRHFQTAEARADEIEGEFYWQIRAGETVEAEDYVSPPYLLSVERTEGEVAWTRGEYVPGREVWTAFALPGRPPAPIGVAPAQPNPWAERSARAWRIALLAIAAILVVSLAVAATRPRETVLTLDVPLRAGQVTLSEPFALRGGPQAVEVEAAAEVRQAWVGLDVALIEESTGEAEAMGIELSHYSGVEGGESWTEGSRRGNAVAGSVPDGSYLLRVEPVSEAAPGGLVPPVGRVRVIRGVFLWTPPVLALLLVAAFPLFASIRRGVFEQARWAESDHARGPSAKGAGDDE